MLEDWAASVSKHHAMVTYVVVKIKLHTFYNTVLEGCFIPWEQTPVRSRKSSTK